tara:strand:+ start:1453 stop:1635 length:183 start_codon:yes stop_codon:yes gene_type:complete
MQFQRNSSIARNGMKKVIIKVFLIFLILFISVILVDKIDFPSPNKKIEKIIPDENLKIVK